jgi:hypothetical protein
MTEERARRERTADDHPGAAGVDEPRRVAASLDQVARSLGGPGAGVWSAVFADWTDIVGPVVADHCWPVSLRKGVLVVGVAEPIWHTQLTYMQHEILERLASVVGPGTVSRVDVRVRPRRHPPLVD